MANEQKRVPNLRFKGFTNVWEQRKLGEISDTFSGGTPNVSNSNFYGGNIPFIRSAEINKKSTELFLTLAGLNNSSAKLINKGTLLYALYGATSGEVGVAQIDGAINQAIMAINLYQDNTYFVKSWLVKNKEHIISTYLQGGQGNLSAKIIKSLDLKLPKISEQIEISDLMIKVDDLISLQQRKMALLKQLKKGLLQKMFADKDHKQPVLRFEGFHDDWEQRKLGEISEIVRGASPRPIKDKKWFDNNSSIGWIRISDVTEQKGRIHQLRQHLSKVGQEKTRVITEPHLLLSIAASVGFPVINYIPTGVHDGFLIFKKPKFNINFMFYWLENYKTQWEKYGQPGSQVNLNSSIVENTSLRLPNSKEQKMISLLLDKVQDLLSLQQQRLNKLTSFKQFLLQQMFI